MNLTSLSFLVAGLVILTAGAEFLIRGASRLAAALGVSPLVIGLTIVAYGTSMPELVVSIAAGLDGHDTVAVANVVGSNICNVLLILGVCAVILPLNVSSQLIRIDVPIMIAVSILFVVLTWDGHIGWLDGLILVLLMIVYTTWSIRKSRRENKAIQEEFAKEFGHPTPAESTFRATMFQLFLIVIGLGMMTLGARWFVAGAIDIARWLGVTEVVIGLTIVAIGTSLPELATSVVASIRGERDIAIGNVVGSNISNIMMILGIASIVTPGGLTVDPTLGSVDIPIMLLVALACFPIFWTGAAIDRWEGALFLTAYVVYMAYLVFTATSAPAATAGTPGGILPLLC